MSLAKIVIWAQPMCPVLYFRLCSSSVSVLQFALWGSLYLFSYDAAGRGPANVDSVLSRKNLFDIYLM